VRKRSIGEQVKWILKRLLAGARPSLAWRVSLAQAIGTLQSGR